MCASWGVSTPRVSSVRFRAVSPVARSSLRALGNPVGPDVAEHFHGRLGVAQANRHAGSRAATIRRTGAGRGRGATLAEREAISSGEAWDEEGVAAAELRIDRLKAQLGDPTPAVTTTTFRFY